ncbi:hypothetical protein HPP92_027824 [Vanilla planifolia]|uniref:Uncharacterized protein n=1 Tax=Vanilla planifolia TaxID=51239 RepID=A0A835P7L0_VANPL|nr:hypothetical protein HPP92_027824 [Vanilla planifolia]KAG0448598.1 hypothetical protein HPP92_027768 [Vanilla planifolia]
MEIVEEEIKDCRGKEEAEMKEDEGRRKMRMIAGGGRDGRREEDEEEEEEEGDEDEHGHELKIERWKCDKDEMKRLDGGGKEKGRGRKSRGRE